jgi:hypothetical protein
LNESTKFAGYELTAHNFKIILLVKTQISKGIN